MPYEINAGENLVIKFALMAMADGQTFQGDWDAGTAYVIDDVVVNGGKFNGRKLGQALEHSVKFVTSVSLANFELQLREFAQNIFLVPYVCGSADRYRSGNGRAFPYCNTMARALH